MGMNIEEELYKMRETYLRLKSQLTLKQMETYEYLLILEGMSARLDKIEAEIGATEKRPVESPEMRRAGELADKFFTEMEEATAGWTRNWSWTSSR